MAPTSALERLRVGWWAGAEPSDPLAALAGSLLRAEMVSRCPGLSPVLVYGAPASWLGPGFTGEAVSALAGPEWGRPQPSTLDLLVASGAPEPGGTKLAQALAEGGTVTVPVAPGQPWGCDERSCVGAPFAVPEPSLLAARHLRGSLLAARGAYLRVVEGLPRHYVLVEGGLLDEEPAALRRDLELALIALAEAAGKEAGEERPAEIVRLAPAALANDDAELEAVLRERRAEAEEGRYQAEDWPGYPDRARLPLKVASPVDLAAAVALADAVVATSGALMALAWSLGAPHVAVGHEESSASNFAAWTGDPSTLVGEPAELASAMGNILARRGEPHGLKRLEATLDQSLDEAASNLEKGAAQVAAGDRAKHNEASLEERLHELEAANNALRLRLAAERLRFGERAALLEKAASTTVESAVKAVHGQDVIVRRRLEETEKEMRRLQEETALQQAELRAIHSSFTMRALAPARQWYGRLRKGVR